MHLHPHKHASTPSQACIYTLTNMHLHPHTHASTPSQACIYTLTSMDLHPHKHASTPSQACIFILTYMHLHIQKHAYTPSQTCIYTLTSMHASTPSQTCMHCEAPGSSLEFTLRCVPNITDLNRLDIHEWVALSRQSRPVFRGCPVRSFKSVPPFYDPSCGFSQPNTAVVLVVVVVGQTVGSNSSKTLAYDCLCTLGIDNECH